VAVDTEILAGVAIITVSGTMNSALTEAVSATIDQLLDRGYREFVLNLEPVVGVIDSAGLGGIVRVYTTVARRGGALRLEGLNKRLRELSGITKLTQLFDSNDPPAPDPFNPTFRDEWWKPTVLGLLLAIVMTIIWLWARGHAASHAY